MKKGKAASRQHRHLKCNPNVTHSFKTKRPKSGLINRQRMMNQGIDPPKKTRSHKKHSGPARFEDDENKVIVCRLCGRVKEFAVMWGDWELCKTCAEEVHADG